jgi:hypothetical protein
MGRQGHSVSTVLSKEEKRDAVFVMRKNTLASLIELINRH